MGLVFVRVVQNVISILPFGFDFPHASDSKRERHNRGEGGVCVLKS